MLRFPCAAAVALLAFTLPPVANAQATQPAQRPASMKTKITLDVEVNYLVFLPKDYGKDPNKTWPLILFLHGAGERGNDLDKVKLHGPPKIVEKNPDFPFVVVSPQCPDRRWWEPAVVNALLDKVTADLKVDPDRVYLTGISMGGYGTWATAAERPDRFAAIVPICGGGETSTAAKLKDLPTWVFHGEQDKAVPIARSEEMVDAIRKAGGSPQFTRYPDAGHDSWTVTYDNPELYDWLLKHKRTSPAAAVRRGR